MDDAPTDLGLITEQRDFQKAVNLLTSQSFEEDEEDEVGIPRWKLLPHLFSVKGKPYSLDAYPQFRPLYSKRMVPQCIYLCGRQVAKSSNLSRSEVLTAIQMPNFQQLYVAPLASQSQRYSVLYLNEAIKSCAAATQLQNPYFSQFLPKHCRGNIDVVKAVMHKTFLNGASLMLSYAKSDSERARGITADQIDFDEIQSMLIDSVHIVSESLTNSSYNCRRYTGTALTMDSAGEVLWQRSSQGEWGVRCTACNYVNIPNMEFDVLQMIGSKGPICAKPHCRRPLNVRNGRWIHKYTDRTDEFPGYRIGQLVLPAIVESPVKWANLVRKVASLPPTTVLNEIFGISSDFGARLITQGDIDRVSVLDDTDALYERRHTNYTHRVIGIDWGVAELTSFNVAAVYGVTPNGEVHCLYARRYVGMNVEEVVEDVVRLYHMWDCAYAAPDFGMGYLSNTMLANRGLRVVQCQYVTQNKFLSPKSMHGITVWTVDRNTALGTIFHNIKRGKILFSRPEFSKDYTSDLLAPYEELQESEVGIYRKKFLRAASKPDDFVHATTFATLVLWQITGNPIVGTLPEHANGAQSIEGQQADFEFDYVSDWEATAELMARQSEMMQAAQRRR